MGRPKKRRYNKKMDGINTLLSSRGRPSKRLSEFVNKFFRPLLPSVTIAEHENTAEVLLNLFFNPTTRSLTWYRTTEEFKLPGEKYYTGMKSAPGLGPRNLKENELLLVVEDSKLEYVKVEVCRKRSEHNYRLTKAEWNYAKKKLRRV